MADMENGKILSFKVPLSMSFIFKYFWHFKTKNIKIKLKKMLK